MFNQLKILTKQESCFKFRSLLVSIKQIKQSQLLLK